MREIMPDDSINASDVVVLFKDENGQLREVPVSDLMNDLFTYVFQLEARVEELEKSTGTKKPNSPIITLG